MANKNRNKLRRLKYLMNKHPSYSMTKTQLREHFFSTESAHINSKTGNYDLILELLDIYRLSDELGFSEEEREKLWQQIRMIRLKAQAKNHLKPHKESRDNKGVYVGSGGSNKNKVRYPSKKRSLRVWKKFYTLFPYHAKIDGWNGKTSKRMK